MYANSVPIADMWYIVLTKQIYKTNPNAIKTPIAQ
jgi:hypothetical protein